MCPLPIKPGFLELEDTVLEFSLLIPSLNTNIGAILVGADHHPDLIFFQVYINQR